MAKITSEQGVGYMSNNTLVPGKVLVLAHLCDYIDFDRGNRDIRDAILGSFCGWFYKDGLTSKHCTNIKWGGFHAEDIRDTAQYWSSIQGQKLWMDLNSESVDKLHMTSELTAENLARILRYPSNYATGTLTANLIV